MSYEFRGFIQQGWQCPICRRVYSPLTSMCLYCGTGEISTSTSTNIETVSNKNNKDGNKVSVQHIIERIMKGLDTDE